jgi:hypothetical protein
MRVEKLAYQQAVLKVARWVALKEKKQQVEKMVAD